MVTSLTDMEISRLGLSPETISEIIDDKHCLFETVLQRRREVKINERSEYEIQTIIKNKSDLKYYSVTWLDLIIPEGEGHLYDISLSVRRISFLKAKVIKKLEQLHPIFRIVIMTFLTILVLFILGTIGQLGQIFPIGYFIVTSILPASIYLASFSKVFRKTNPDIAEVFKIAVYILLAINILLSGAITSIPIREFFSLNTYSVFIYMLYLIIITSIAIANYFLIQKSFDKIKFD